jgi:hypothetical protein
MAQPIDRSKSQIITPMKRRFSTTCSVTRDCSRTSSGRSWQTPLLLSNISLLSPYSAVVLSRHISIKCRPSPLSAELPFAQSWAGLYGTTGWDKRKRKKLGQQHWLNPLKAEKMCQVPALPGRRKNLKGWDCRSQTAPHIDRATLIAPVRRRSHPINLIIPRVKRTMSTHPVRRIPTIRPSSTGRRLVRLGTNSVLRLRNLLC